MIKTITIDDREIGPGKPIFIIAEVGSNHDGSLKRARELISASKDAGANAVKFQSFTASGLINPLRPLKGSTHKKILGWERHPAYSLIDSLTMPLAWHAELKEYADKEGIIFLSAPFDSERAELLNSIGVGAFKVASGDITNIPLLRQIASYQKPIILSTGASYLGEVESAISAIEAAGCVDIALLHCVSLYPPRFEDVNLRAMETMRHALKRPVGISDHTPGAVVPLGALALGASIVEKHITFDKTLNGPDHPYAMDTVEFQEMVYELRLLERALGNGIKRPCEKEEAERLGARRSIYTTTDIASGTTITRDMLKLVRHGYGIEPEKLECILGMKTRRDLSADYLLSWEVLER